MPAVGFAAANTGAMLSADIAAPMTNAINCFVLIFRGSLRKLPVLRRTRRGVNLAMHCNAFGASLAAHGLLRGTASVGGARFHVHVHPAPFFLRVRIDMSHPIQDHWNP